MWENSQQGAEFTGEGSLAPPGLLARETGKAAGGERAGERTPPPGLLSSVGLLFE